MNANPIFGTFVFLLGGIAAATYLLPFLGEWKGTSGRTKVLLAGGIVILAVGFTVRALGGK